jgi:hypothetical protein
VARRLMVLLIQKLSTQRQAGQQAEIAAVRSLLAQIEVDRLLGRAA